MAFASTARKLCDRTPTFIVLGAIADIITLLTLDVGGTSENPAALTIDFSSNRTEFAWKLVGHNITKDVHQRLVGTAGGSVVLKDGTVVNNVPFWTYTLDIDLTQDVEKPSYEVDTLLVRGDVVHVIPGHPEDANRTLGALAYGFAAIEADSAKAGVIKKDLDLDEKPHPPKHFDRTLLHKLLADVAFVDNTVFDDEYNFTRFQIDLDGVHRKAARSADEPSTILLLLVALVLLSRMRLAQAFIKARIVSSPL